jgi:hypothetical protein
LLLLSVLLLLLLELQTPRAWVLLKELLLLQLGLQLLPIWLQVLLLLKLLFRNAIAAANGRMCPGL